MGLNLNQLRVSRAGLVALALALPVQGCDSILDTDLSDITTENSFSDLTAVSSIRASVAGQFASGYEDLVLYGGLLGDEWAHSGTFPTRREVDQRSITTENATLQATFRGLARGGAMADYATELYQRIDTAGAQNVARAEALSLAGYTFVVFAENYCEGVPISRLVRTASGRDTAIYGPPLTRNQMLDTAIARFDAALARGVTGTQQYVAQVGRGRALLNQGRFQEAAAAVAGVPTTFVYQLEHSNNSSGENNLIWSFNINQERWSATNGEGTNGLPYLAARDPRMLWRRFPSNDVGFDRRTPQYDALKYPDRPAFTVLADGVEARLIEAEAKVRAGDPTYITILNSLRASVAQLMPLRNYDHQRQLSLSNSAGTLAPLVPAATPREQVMQLFQERAYWLWLTGHRLGDMRRLIRQYGFSQDQVFPVGQYAPNGNNKGGFYGSDVNLPIPFQELNNPSEGAGECLNRAA